MKIDHGKKKPIQMDINGDFKHRFNFLEYYMKDTHYVEIFYLIAVCFYMFV
jgi:hypothetical protein